MKFQYEYFSCDVDIFRNGENLTVRFYDKFMEQSEEQIVNLVIVEPGFGYICLKFKGDDGLLSGFLDKHVFYNEHMVDAAIEFVESLAPKARFAYLPHHIDSSAKRWLCGIQRGILANDLNNRESDLHALRNRISISYLFTQQQALHKG